MNDKQLQLMQRLEQSFGLRLDSAQDLDTESEFFKRLQLKLAERIQFFINTDMDKLLHALYRIDIKERDSDAAFNLGKIELISMKLAELIIVRQLQKLDYSRNFYSQNPRGDGDE